MSNPTISQIKVGDITYDICDENLRNTLFNSSTLEFENIRTITFGNSNVTAGDEFQFRVKDNENFTSGAYFMKVITGASTGGGDGIVIDAGGLTCIGGGEAGRSIYDVLINGGTTPAHEQLHLASDNEIQFHSACQNIANRKTMILDTSGNLTVPGNIVPKSQTKNTVFAAPNGSNGTPSFRALVLADLPNINASKITAGILPAALGGTGNNSLQATRNAMGLGNTTGALPIANGGTAATTKIAGFKALGGWTSVATTSGTTAKTFTNVSTTGYTEVLIMAAYSGTVGSTDYKSSVLIPVAQLSSGGDDYYLGGGWWNNSYGASANVSLTKITPYQGKVNGSSVNMSWTVYAR